MRRRRSISIALAAFVVAVLGCFHHSQSDTDFNPPPDPIPVHIRNENFLDMNVAVVTSGMSRRLGTVTGNSAGDFRIPWNVANGQSIIITATPIGGRGQATSGALTVGPGQMIDFRIGSTLRQSTATVHDPQ